MANNPFAVSGRFRAPALVTALFAVNALLWIAAWAASARYPFMVATGWLAYGFGLRHAVDADHISAIDNTTRKLMNQGKRPLGVGFFFSLGHSTVVLLICAALATATGYAQRHLPVWKAVGSQVGTVISGGFLYVIGLINLIVLIDLYRKSRQMMRAGETGAEGQAEDAPMPGGILARLFMPLLRMVRHSRQMYLVGFLFGLGFDTASEVGILALSARSGQAGIPFWIIMLLPLLFTAGMCLIDTLNGILMLGVYGWAHVRPERKIRYNLGITSISVLVAFVVGTHELLGMFNIDDLPKGAFWTILNDNLGFVIVAIFAAIGAFSVLISRRVKAQTA